MHPAQDKIIPPIIIHTAPTILPQPVVDKKDTKQESIGELSHFSRQYRPANSRELT